jgi:heme/copper-type cytochrome/quinol oxidase subunit 2
MKPHRVVLGVFALVVLPLFAIGEAPAAAGDGWQQAPPAVKVIELTATKYKFTPGEVEVPLHTVVQFKITAADRDHGFEIEGVKDSCVKIAKGTTKTVEYKAEKAGKIKFKCCDFCGLGHGRMQGYLIVK